MTNPWFEERKQCPACASDWIRTIYETQYDEPPVRDYLVGFYTPQGMVESEYLDGALYVLCECQVCGLVFQRDVPGGILTERLYEHWIDPTKAVSEPQLQACLGYYSEYAQEIMQISAYIGARSSPRFLDFGMGWSQWALMAKAFGCDSYGTELSRERVAHAKANGIKVVEWEEIPQHRFDFINAEQVFEHIPEPLSTLRHLKLSLKSDGLLKIGVPTANDIERRLKILDWKCPRGSRNSLNPVAPLEHINLFGRASLLKMASEAGMEEVLIPMKVQYRFTTDWHGARNAAKNVLRPIYRNVIRRQARIFLRKLQPSQK